MASEIVSLLRIQLYEELRIGAIAHRGAGSRDAVTYLVSIVLVAVILGFMVHMAVGSLSAMGFEDEAILLAAFVSLTVSLGASLFRGMHAFVFGDYDLVMSMPISAGRVALSRFLSVYVVAAAISLYLSAVGAVSSGTGAIPAAMLLAGSAVGALIPASIGAAVGTAVTSVGSGSYGRWSHSLLALAAVVIALVVLMTYLSEGQGVGSIGSVFGNVSSWCPPAGWLAGWTVPEWSDVAVLAVASAASSATVVIAASRLLGRLNSRSPTVRPGARAETRVRGRLGSMYRRDLRRYMSSRVYVMNTAVGMLLLVVLSYMVAFTDVSSSDDLGELLPVLTSALPMFVAFFIGLSSTTAVSLSMEGASRWIIGTMPLRPWEVFLPKILVNLTLTLPLGMVSVAIQAAGLGVSGADLALLVAVPVAYALFVPALGMAMNVRFPRYDWTSEYYAVKGGSVSMLGTMGIGVASVLVPLLLSMALPGMSDVVMSVATVVILVAAALLYAHLRRIELRLYRRGRLGINRPRTLPEVCACGHFALRKMGRGPRPPCPRKDQRTSSASLRSVYSFQKSSARTDGSHLSPGAMRPVTVRMPT